jgi:hypothetical protein
MQKIIKKYKFIFFILVVFFIYQGTIFIDKYEQKISKTRILKNNISLDTQDVIRNLKKIPTVYTVFSETKTGSSSDIDVQKKISDLFGIKVIDTGRTIQLAKIKQKKIEKKDPAPISKPKPKPKSISKQVPTVNPSPIDASVEEKQKPSPVVKKITIVTNDKEDKEVKSNVKQLQVASRLIKIHGYTDDGIIINTRYYPINSRLEDFPIYFYTKDGIIMDFAKIIKVNNVFYLSYGNDKAKLFKG